MRRSGVAWGVGTFVVVGVVVGMLVALMAVRSSARAAPLVTTIATTSGFPSLTLASGRRAILADQMNRRVHIVDTTTGRIISTLTAGGGGGGPSLPLAVDARLHRAFVAWPVPATGHGVAMTIAAIDLASGRTLGIVTITLSPRSFGWPAYLAVDTRRHRLFVLPLSYPATSLLTLDTTRLRVLRTVALSPWRAGGGSWGTDGAPLAVDEVTGRVFVGRVDEEAVSVLDATSGRLLRTVTLPPLPSSAGIATQVACPLIDPSHARVYIPNPAANTVTTLDARTGTIIRTVHLAFPPARPVVDRAAGRVFLPYQSQYGFAVLDARSGRLLLTRASGRNPAITPVALDEGRQRAFVADDMGGTVAVEDLRTGRTLRTVGVGVHPSGLAFDRRHYRVLVTDAGPCCTNGQQTGDGTLVVLDGANGRVVRTIPLGRSPQQPLIDAPAGRVLVVNGGGGTVTDPDPWGWVPRPIRQRLSVLPHPRTRTVPGSVMVFDLTQVTQG